MFYRMQIRWNIASMYRSTLKSLPIFEDSTPEQVALIIRNSRIINCDNGNFLFRHGDRITHFYVICRGAIQLFRQTPLGYEATSNILTAGDSINAEELVACQAEHAMSARAVEYCSLLEIPISWMRDNFNELGNIAAKLLAVLADRLGNAQIEIEHHSTMSAAHIVACYLQKLCVKYNFDPLGFTLPYSKQLIASRLRMERETLSRALRALKDHGVTVTGSYVSFENTRKTGNFVCQKCSVSSRCEAYRELHQAAQQKSAGGARSVPLASNLYAQGGNLTIPLR